MARKLFGVILAAVVTVATGGFGGALGKFATGLGSKFGLSGLAANKFGSFLIRAGLGLALANQTPRLPSKGYQVNQKGSNLDHQIIYGKTKVAGAIIFDGTTGSSNKYLHRVIAVAGHEVNSFEEIWLNDYKLTLDGNGEVTSATNDGGSTTTTRYNGYVRVNTHVGTDNQSADSDLVSEVTDWTSAHRLRGIAYMYVRLKFNADVFPNGIPEIQAVVKGKKVYDTRTSTTSWSDNPALCIRDYLVSSYGLNAETTEIDESLITEAANYCDTTASNSDNFFTMNGAFTTGSQPIDILNDMLTSMCGVMWYAQGEWRMRAAPAKISSSNFNNLVTLTLDEDDLRGPLDVNTRHSRRDNFNVIKGTWRGEDSEWQNTDFPEYKVAQAITDDGGEESVFDMALNFTDNSAEAERIARIVYERNRQQLTVSGTFGLKAMKCQVGDFIQLDNARMGWTSKYFEVTEWSFGMDGMDLAINMVLREISYDVFDEVSSYTTLENDNTTLASPFDAQDVTVATPVASSSLNGDGTVVPKLKWTWSVDDESDVDYYVFGWRIGASGTFNEFVIKEKKFEIEPAVAGAAYYYTIKAVNYLGVSGTASTGNVTAVNDTTAPSVPTGLSATGGHKLIELSWTNPTDADFRHVKVQVSTDNSTFIDLGFTSGTSFVHAGLGDEVQRYYRVRAEDFSDNVSSYTSSENATTLVSPKGDTGDRGAGRWYVSVTTLPTTSSAANTAFTADVGNPVDRDQAWFYEGTQANPTAQNVWIYTESTDTWAAQEEFIDGNLVVAGTITSDKITAGAITTDKIDAGAITAEKITVDGELVLDDDAGFIAGRSFNSDYGTDGFFVGRETRADGTQGFEVSTSSINTDNEITGIIHNEVTDLQIFNPKFIIGGSATGGVTTYTSDQTKDLGVNTGKTITITAVGGGGGGGGGHDDQGDDAGGTGASGTATTVNVYHTSVSASNLITTITSNGGGGGQSGGGGREASGGNGGGTSFGSGGAGGALNTAGSDAPSTSYGAGGGGGGGDAGGTFDSSGAAGLGGAASVATVANLEITQTTNIYAVISVGSGGAGDTTGVTFAGGDGANGVVTISSVLGGTETFKASTLPYMFDALASGVAHQENLNRNFQSSSVSLVPSSQDHGNLYLYKDIFSTSGQGDPYIVHPAGTRALIHVPSYIDDTTNSSEKDVTAGASQRSYRWSTAFRSKYGVGYVYLPPGGYIYSNASLYLGATMLSSTSNTTLGEYSGRWRLIENIPIEDAIKIINKFAGRHGVNTI